MKKDENMVDNGKVFLLATLSMHSGEVAPSQSAPLIAYKLITKDSVEEKILQLQEQKKSLVKNLITTEGGFFKSLGKEDIISLFS